MQKMVDFYHNKGTGMLKIWCTLLNLANICLHKSTTATIYPSIESNGDLPEIIQEDIVGGLSFDMKSRAVVDETLIWDSTNWCKTIFGTDASQLYSFSMCQAMPTGLYTTWALDSESGNFKPCQNKRKSFGTMVMSYFQRVRQQCKVESFYTIGTQKKIGTFSVDGFCGHCITVFEAMGCFYHYCLCQEARPSLTEEENQRGI